MSAPRPILIHGSGGDHRLWAAQTAAFAGAVAVDLPGHPGGEPLTTLPELAAAVATGVATIPGPRVLVGHSLGGAVALEIARARPELVDGVVVIASGLRLSVPEETVARAREDFAAECERLVRGSFADPAAAMAATARAALADAGPAALAADYAACRSVDLREGVAGIRVPALVICGDDDPFTPLHHNESLARALPMGRLVVVPGARHLVHAEFGGTVNGLLAGYLARLELTLDGA